VWDAVRDVGAVHRRLVPGRAADARIEGDMRILTMPDGSTVRELIVSVDDERRRLAYAVIESRMGLTHHHATIEIFPHGNGRTRLVWTTDALPDSLAPSIQIRMERGVAVMKETLERASRDD
jgi:hypothetical protein